MGAFGRCYPLSLHRGRQNKLIKQGYPEIGIVKQEWAQKPRSVYAG